ncbi:unnamed protein product [Paramecium sonneborni]|uniref:Uncharacterized protein n=1 Tax=Paramecium sonneborni TaxID=65129 RepID=A0A8S1QLU8_9CILI|nr:unnamed protein product [Paramecium sonneborni]
MGNICQCQALDIIQINRQDSLSETQINQQENIISVIWDSKGQRFVKTRFNLIKKENKEIRYVEAGGAFVKIDQFKDYSVRPEKTMNLEYMQNCKWIGQHGEKLQKIGKWTASWKGQKMDRVGGYYSNDGQKEGFWNELLENYWSRGQVQSYGEYFNNQKIGSWNYIYFKNIIGGGYYNEKGQRNGKWIVLSDKFWDCSQITYHGEYRNGNKIGRWDIYFEKKLIGGGQYYQNQRNKNGFKIGRWIGPNDWQSQIIDDGIYKEGRKIGRWDIWFQKDYENKQLVGGGQYQEKQQDGQLTESIKIGKWTELFDGFSNNSQITYIGEYQNGKKVGRWSIFYMDLWTKQNNLMQININYLCIVEVDYIILNKKEMKLQIHIRLVDGLTQMMVFGGIRQISFISYGQVFYTGNYIDGKKNGKWAIYFKDEWKNEKQLIGGGTYKVDQEDDNFIISNKIGYWIELSDNFGDGFGQQQIIFTGEYKNGKKFGIWNVMKRDKYKMEAGFKTILQNKIEGQN